MQIEAAKKRKSFYACSNLKNKFAMLYYRKVAYDLNIVL